MPSPPGLERHLKGRLADGGKLFVPYLTCGIPSPDGFLEAFGVLAETADAIEVGIPFSDPVMDGPVIQASSMRAIEAGMTLDRCFSLISDATAGADIPVVVMTYFNPIHRRGIHDFTTWLWESGVTGLIVPDLPYEEGEELNDALEDAGVAHIQMVAPTTSPERAAMLASASRGFVYAVSRLGVTGERESLERAASRVVALVRPHTDIPVLLGIGITTGEQARQACEIADGVIVGSAIVARVLEGDTAGAGALAKEIRGAIGEQ
ncbi:MAG: tryptophan synthase subunit alpha [Actinomycetota bacterium]|nr:tryptophan synthase subunit alpha [Actinomycetota bacterium]